MGRHVDDVHVVVDDVGKILQRDPGLACGRLRRRQRAPAVHLKVVGKAQVVPAPPEPPVPATPPLAEPPVPVATPLGLLLEQAAKSSRRERGRDLAKGDDGRWGAWDSYYHCRRVPARLRPRPPLRRIIARYPTMQASWLARSSARRSARAAVAQRAGDGFGDLHFFQGDDAPGRWRPTPNLSGVQPDQRYSPASVCRRQRRSGPAPAHAGHTGVSAAARPRPAASGTAQLGAGTGADEPAHFLGVPDLPAGLREPRRAVARRAHPPRGGVYDEARVMAELTAALADSAILTWNEKAKFSRSRRGRSPRSAPTELTPPGSRSIETPPFPGYPSGHATDCYVGASVLEAAFPDLASPIVYLSSAHMEPLDGVAIPAAPASYGMGRTPNQASRRRPGEASVVSRVLPPLPRNVRARGSWAGARSRRRRWNRSDWPASSSTGHSPRRTPLRLVRRDSGTVGRPSPRPPADPRRLRLLWASSCGSCSRRPKRRRRRRRLSRTSSSWSVPAG